MAELDEGAYVIISVLSGKAVDVKGAQDKSGVNVQIFTVNNKDSQIWYVTKPEDNYWMLDCSLSIRVMGASAPNSSGVRNVVQQDNVMNTTTQRWQITDTGNTYTYNSVSYHTYRINWVGNLSLGLDVEYFGTQDGANIALHGVGSNPTANQQWIFVPVGYLSEDGFYKIGAAKFNNVLGIAAGSTDNGAKCVLESENNSVDSQTFFTKRDSSSGAYYLEAVHSGMHLDVWGGYDSIGTNPYVNQGTVHMGYSNQLWFPTQVPGKDGVVVRNGTPYPVYELRAVVGANYVLSMYKAGNSSDKRLYVHPRVGQYGNDAQHFIFMRTEGYDKNIDQPGSISPSSFSRNGFGTVSLSGLSFQSKYEMFQARYRLITYSDLLKINKTVGNWKNFADDSESRDGWGDVNTPTFTSENSSGTVLVPVDKTVALSNSAQSIDVEIEVRPLLDNYKGSYVAHGPSKVSTVSVNLIPTVSVESFNLKSVDGKLGFLGSFENEPSVSVVSLRSRILDSQHNPISEYVFSYDMSCFYPLEGMSRIPENGESVTIEYSMLTIGGDNLTGSFDFTVNYVEDENSYETEYLSDSETVKVFTETHSYDFCFVVNKLPDGLRLVQCPKCDDGFIVAPSLNRDSDVYVIYSDDGETWQVASFVCRVDSHLFIWNWSKNSESVPYENSAAIIINSDAPPQQTRKFTSGIRFESSIGRKYQIGFSDKTISADLSVSGVIVDEDARYVSSGPIPNSVRENRIRSLIGLSGIGVHPIYRTPYGDYSEVGIESVDISKKEQGLSDVSITQRAVKD